MMKNLPRGMELFSSPAHSLLQSIASSPPILVSQPAFSPWRFSFLRGTRRIKKGRISLRSKVKVFYIKFGS